MSNTRFLTIAAALAHALTGVWVVANPTSMHVELRGPDGERIQFRSRGPINHAVVGRVDYCLITRLPPDLCDVWRDTGNPEVRDQVNTNSNQPIPAVARRIENDLLPPYRQVLDQARALKVRRDTEKADTDDLANAMIAAAKLTHYDQYDTDNGATVSFTDECVGHFAISRHIDGWVDITVKVPRREAVPFAEFLSTYTTPNPAAITQHTTGEQP